MLATPKCAHNSFFYDKGVQKIIVKWLSVTSPSTIYTTAHFVNILITSSRFNGKLRAFYPSQIKRAAREVIDKLFTSNILLFSELAVAIERYYRNPAIADYIYDAAYAKYIPYIDSIKVTQKRLPRKLLSVLVFEHTGERISPKAAIHSLRREIARRSKIDRKWNCIICEGANRSHGNPLFQALPEKLQQQEVLFAGLCGDPDRKQKTTTSFRTPAEFLADMKRHMRLREIQQVKILEQAKQHLDSRDSMTSH
jgi:hypothetical protein